MPATAGDLRRMQRDLDAAARTLRDAGTVLIVSHIDADGISAGAIADITAERLGKDHTVRFEKKISEETLEMINSSSEDVVWICDLGSGYLSEFSRDGIIVTDHHVPDPRWRRKQTVLDSFSGITHLNPHSYGMDGSYEICGAGMTYLLSKAVDPANVDLAYLAVVGAVGDFQDSGHSALVSMNRTVMADAQANGDLVVDQDLRFFGRETRAINQYLQFSSDPQIPGLSDNAAACLQFLDRMGIKGKEGGRWRHWDDLSQEERERATEAILDMMPEGDRERAFGEMYRFPNEPEGTGLRDAKEFATVLNSCGRYDDAETGLRICRGDMTALVGDVVHPRQPPPEGEEVHPVVRRWVGDQGDRRRYSRGDGPQLGRVLQEHPHNSFRRLGRRSQGVGEGEQEPRGQGARPVAGHEDRLGAGGGIRGRAHRPRRRSSSTSWRTSCPRRWSEVAAGG